MDPETPGQPGWFDTLDAETRGRQAADEIYACWVQLHAKSGNDVSKMSPRMIEAAVIKYIENFSGMYDEPEE